MSVVWVAFDFMEQFMVNVFTGVGVSQEDAKVCAEVLITSDKRGIDSHGVNRLKSMYYNRIKQGIQQPITMFEVVREGPTTAMVVAKNSTHFGIAG